MEFTLKNLILGTLLLVIGGGVAAYSLGIIKSPDFGIDDRGDWRVEDDQVSIVSEGYIYNPNSIGMNLSTLDLDYALKMNGVKLAGGGKESLHIPEDSNKSIEVETDLIMENIPEWWSSHINNRETSTLEVPIKLEVTSFQPFSVNEITYTDSISTTLEEKLDNAFSSLEGTYEKDFTPIGSSATTTRIQVAEASGKWGEATKGETEVISTLQLYNPNNYPIPTPQFTGNLEMNEVVVADWQANDITVMNAPKDSQIKPGETKQVKLKATIDNENIDDWLVSHIQRGEQTDAKFDVKLVFDFQEARVEAPNSKGMKCRFSFTTVILEDNQKPGSTYKGCQEAIDESEFSSSTDSTTDDSTNTDSTDETEEENNSLSSDSGIIYE